MIDFSLNLLCNERRHLISATLDSLKNQSGAFEVLLLDGEGESKLEEIAASYPDLKVRVEHTPCKTNAEMMNLGLTLSKGKYIQFIEPGDRYISQQGLHFLSQWIQEHKEPDYVFGNWLVDGEVAGPEVSRSRSPWFLRTKILKMGGFSSHLQLRPTFDLICRLNHCKEIRGLFCPRVFIDPVPRKMGVGYIRETWAILRAHYGLWEALKWIVRHDHTILFRRLIHTLKRSFKKQD